MIERLTVDHLPGCLDLAGDRDWPRDEHVWRLLFDIGEVLGLVAPDEGVVGTAVITRLPPGAALSMVLVASRRERQGLGGRLVRAALERAGDGPVYLFATEYGRPLYERLGFVTTGSGTTHLGQWRARPGEGDGSRPARGEDWDAIAALDAEVAGVDRRRMVERLEAFAEEVRVAERGGRIAGYGARWPRAQHAQIGPVITDDAGVARELIADLAVRDGSVRIDVYDAHTELMKWLQGHGLEAAPAVARMDFGALPRRDAARLVAAFMQPLG